MLKVVIIDNNAISRNLLTSVLMSGGHEVIGDSNTSSAGVASMIKLKPQIVCIDLGQKNSEQMDLLDTIHAALPKALIFIVSVNIDADLVQNTIQRGAHGFIVKPFKAQTVLKTIRDTIIRMAKKHKTN